MVLLTISPAACEAIRAYDSLLGGFEHEHDEPSLTEAATGDPITHAQLIKLSNGLARRQREHGDVSCAFALDTLLKGAKVYVPPPKPKAEKSPEYVRLMARLREAEDRRQYERMTNPLPPQETFQRRFPGAKTFGSSLMAEPVPVELDDVTYADINRQMTLIINVLVTIIACSVGIWITAWHWPTPARLGLSMGGSGVVAAAEVAIYFGYIKRLSDAKKKERKVVESKEVVDTWVIDGKSQKDEKGLRHRKGKHR